MLQKIESTKFLGKGPIRVLYPGSILGQYDTGIASIGRIDHANFGPGAFVPMHPHVNDEILSYFRSGIVKHRDSEGFTEFITKDRLMLMKAGSSFYHEEKILDDSEDLEALQIFIRPGKKDLKPEVIFHQLENVYSDNQWRLLASPTSETALRFSSQTWIFDVRLDAGKMFTLPIALSGNLTALLYTFGGNILVNDDITLSKKDGLIINGESIHIAASERSELVLFVTDTTAEYYDEGMYSGNQVARLHFA